MTHRSFITLASNGSLDSYPTNKLNYFTNVFPKNFFLQHNVLKPQSIYVRLRSIYLSPYLKRGTEHPRSVEVHLNELEPQITSSKYSQSLGSFQLREKGQGYQEIIFHESPFLPLKTTIINRLTVALLTSRGERLKLERGPATFVTLEITNMDLSSAFTVTCSSHLQEELGKNNAQEKLSKFSVTMPQTLDLSGWEVALKSFSLPRNLAKPSVPVEISIETSDTLTKALLKYDLLDFHSFEELLTKMSEELQKSDLKNMLNLGTRAGEAGTPQKWSFFTTNGMVADSIKLTFDETLQHIFGVDEEVEIEGKEASFDIEDLNRIHLYFHPGLGHIYLDIIESSAVGEQLAPLLCIAPITYSSTTNIYEPTHMMFHKVRNQNFDSINFTICEPNGKTYKLTTEGDVIEGTNIVLIFRPIPGKKGRSCTLTSGIC